jgi:formate dehydrogenase accessory protein FdhD
MPCVPWWGVRRSLVGAFNLGQTPPQGDHIRLQRWPDLQRFGRLSSPVESDVRISPEQLGILLNQLQSRDSLYARAGGVHASALSDGKELLVITEDIGRHNTLDRLRGECLMRGIDPNGLILLTSGRVSSEMINKAVQMGSPLVASRTSPTSLTVALARAWNITLCGYVRRNRMKVYAHPERLETPGSLESESNELQAQTAISKD